MTPLIIAVRELQDRQVPWLEERAVALARRERWTWARIARLLDRSRQHAHQRFRTMVPTLPNDPLSEHRQWELTVARLQADISGTGNAATRRDRFGSDEAVPW